MTDPIDDFDVEDTPVTAHYGFTRIGQGEGFDKNGWAFGDADRTKFDDILNALAHHEHTGAPALGDPTEQPALTAVATGGHLAPSTAYYYRLSFLDKWGLESAASPEASITTPDPLPAPAAPAASVEVANGTLSAGVYSYIITVIDAHGGETSPSASNDVTVATGSTNRVRLDLPDLTGGGIAFNIYRARPGQTSYYKIGATTATSWLDSGDTEDQTISAPLVNTTNATASVQVAIASGVIPLGCIGWRIYRTDLSGNYPGDSLVHEVTEGVSDTDTTPVTSWVDTGDALLHGYPLEASSTMASPSVITLDDIQGHLPIAALPRGSQCISAVLPGAVVDGQTITATETVAPVRPTRFTAFFQTPPSGTVTLHAAADGASIDLVCTAANHRGGDPAGYYRLAFPTTDGGTFQAEDGSRSNATDVDIVTDLAAVSGQAVALDLQGDYVQIGLGELDAGSYSSSAVLRAVASDTGADDVTILAVRTDTDAILAQQPYAADGIGTVYAALNGPTFDAPGGIPIALRVAKTGASVAVYNIDALTVTANVPSLAAGLIRITASVTGTADAAGLSANLWF